MGLTTVEWLALFTVGLFILILLMAPIIRDRRRIESTLHRRGESEPEMRGRLFGYDHKPNWENIIAHTITVLLGVGVAFVTGSWLVLFITVTGFLLLLPLIRRRDRTGQPIVPRIVNWGLLGPFLLLLLWGIFDTLLREGVTDSFWGLPFAFCVVAYYAVKNEIQWRKFYARVGSTS
jgi:hypothetical protein